MGAEGVEKSRAMNDDLLVEVCYALPNKQELLQLKLPRGSTVQQAIEASGLLLKYRDIDLKTNKVGIFGKRMTLDAPLRERDRVEIYRPLVVDPKEVRRKRAELSKKMK